MSRYFLLAFLLLCLAYAIQSNPLPEDTQQMKPASNEFEDFTDKMKKLFDSAKEPLTNLQLNDTLEKAKSFIGQAGENIRKEIEKITQQIRD
ncbi:unnamed protein product [Xylocopa violacea]|uniref:Uncharacterized protein n=1 Tax=Xylocopa violacea TaxID=135666 RepID=A0ABP1N7Z4_XYLVO